MTKKEKKILAFSLVISVLLCVPQSVGAMHIMEGILPPVHCISWGALCLPFLVGGLISLRHTLQKDRKSLILLAMSGAFIFLISSLKLPSLSGSCSHMTGTGLTAILFGPVAGSILGLIVLVFQAILLAHGGLTSLGANTFSMAIAGPLLTWLLYLLGKRLHVPRLANVFIAASLGDLFTYCVTSLQLALANPSAYGGVAASIPKFLAVFAPTQLPLAIIEGLLTMLIIVGLERYAKPELRSLGYLKGGA